MWRQPNASIPETKFHKGDRVRFKSGFYLVAGDYQEAKGAIGEILNVNPYTGETSYLCRLEDGTGFFSEDDLEEAKTQDWVDIVCRLGDRQDLTRNQLLSDWEQAVEDKADLETLKRFKAIADVEFPPPQDLVGQLVGVNTPEGSRIAIITETEWHYYADYSCKLEQVGSDEFETRIISASRKSVFPICSIYPQKSCWEVSEVAIAPKPQIQTIQVLTLKQPWASLIFGYQGLLKDCENRYWQPPRGLKEVWIHAGKSWDQEGVYWISEKFGKPLYPGDFPKGQILGKVAIACVTRSSDSPWAIAGQYQWLLKNPQKLIEPIPARGQQKIWETDINFQPEFESCSPTAIYSAELADSPSPPNGQELPKPLPTATSTKMRSPSTNPTFPWFESTEISESSHRRSESSISYQLGSLAREHPTQEAELDSNTQTQPSGGKHCELSAKLNPDMQLSSNPWELSDADLELFLADCQWRDIQESIQSLAQLDSEQATAVNGYLLLPTPTANESRESGRPAGHSKLEKKCRELGLTPAGSQLSPEAMAALMGFPSSWLKTIARTSQPSVQVEQTSESRPESSPENPALQPRLNGASSGSEVTFSKRRSLMKVSGWIEYQQKITTGKKGKKTYEYYYYRWEEWDGDRLLRTPSKRVKPERTRLLKALIERVDFDVRDILARSEDWAY